MRVRELWRYPVKSLGGERVEAVDAVETGLAGDRGYALFDTSTGFGLTARRVPELLFAGAALDADGRLRITLPDGSVAEDDLALSDWLGRPVALRAADEPGSRDYENPADFEDEAGTWEPFRGSPGAFHDSARAVVSLISTASLGDWDRRRFRANVVLEGSGEDELIGTRVALGEAEFDVVKPLGRCVMVTRPQPGGIDKDLDVLRRLHREHDGNLSVGALVAVTGRVAVGDELRPGVRNDHAT